jgi:transcriptional regulator with XRE-family HTH domain
MLLNKTTVKLVRQTLGIELRELAESTGQSKSLFAAVERGDRRLTEDVEYKILTAFDVSTETIQRILDFTATLSLSVSNTSNNVSNSRNAFS